MAGIDERPFGADRQQHLGSVRDDVVPLGAVDL